MGPIGNAQDGKLLMDRSGNVWILSNQYTAINRQLTLYQFDRKIDGFIRYHADLDGAVVKTVCFERGSGG